MQVPTDGASGTAYLLRLGINISFDHVCWPQRSIDVVLLEKATRAESEGLVQVRGACAGGIDHDTVYYAACTKGTA
eukprot:scaffold94740_cov21-Prasinocladus_malaysianus.AAC.1